MRAPSLTAVLPFAAALLAIAVWVLPLQHVGIWTETVITDVPLYQEVADGISAGLLPYLDTPLEYPPGAPLVFWAASLLPGAYDAAFEALMLVMWVAATAGAVVAARVLGMGRVRQTAVGVAMALTPLLLGNVIETRFDAAVSAILAWTVVAAAAGRFRWMWVLLAAAVLVKLAPVALVPALAVWHAHRAGTRAALRGMGLAAGIVAVVIVPIALVAPTGLWGMVEYHLDRPPQIESLPASYMILLHALADVPLTVDTTFGSQGLIGSGPGVVASIATAVVALVVGCVAVLLAGGLRRARPGADARLMVTALACTMAALVAGGKVLSPQFMLWLLPLGLLVSGPYGRWAFGTTLAALVATQLWFPNAYWDLVALREPEIWLLIGRNALLLALVAMAWPRPSSAAQPQGRMLPDAGDSTAAGSAVAARFLTD